MRTVQKQGLVLPHPCPTCGKHIESLDDFRGDGSVREYMISGMCQQCQDEVFGVTHD